MPAPMRSPTCALFWHATVQADANAESLIVMASLQAAEAKLRQAEQGERELQAALGAAQQDAVEAATSAARADKELRAQQSMSAQHQRLLRQAIAHASPSKHPVAPCGASVTPQACSLH